MKNFRELRKHERMDLETPVVFYQDHVDDHHKAMMQNFSEQGMYMEFGEFIMPGSIVHVKTVNYLSMDDYQVRWCKRIEDSDQEMFGIGLRCG